MKPKLRLFTIDYPQPGTEDPFLPQELDALQNHFDIEIFPARISARGSVSQTVSYKVNWSLALFARNKIARLVFTLLSIPRAARSGLRTRSFSFFPRDVAELRDYRIAEFFFSLPGARTKVDVAYAWWAYGLLAGAAASQAGARVYLVGLNGDDFQDYRFPTRKQVAVEELTKRDRVTLLARSHYAVIQLRELYKVPENRILKFSLTTRDHGFYPKPNTARTVIRSVSCNNGAPLKRNNLMLSSLREVARSLPHLKIAHTHIGYLGKSFDEFCSPLPNLEIRETGWEKPEKVTQHYKNGAFDLFLHFSEYEGGVPAALIEASSFDLPLFAFRAGGVPELCRTTFGALNELSASEGEVLTSLRTLILRIASGEVLSGSRDLWLRNHSPQRSADFPLLLLNRAGYNSPQVASREPKPDEKGQ